MLNNATVPLRMDVASPFGPGTLMLSRFWGREEISRPYEFELEMLSASRDLDSTQIVGHPVCVRLLDANDTPHYFHGHINKFVRAGHDDRHAHYRATLVPWLWFLSQTTDCRIFQNLTVPQIIESVLKELGMTNYDISGITQTHLPREYCVQYRETDLNFLSRLMEEEGIFYYFRNTEDKLILVIADRNTTFLHEPQITLRRFERSSQSPDLPQVDKHECALAFVSGRTAHKDYDFKRPSAQLLTKTQSNSAMPNALPLEVFDYPGRYTQRSVGDAYIRARIEELQTSQRVSTATSHVHGLRPGVRMTLDFCQCENGSCRNSVITAVEHEASAAGTYNTSSTNKTDDLYVARYSAIPMAQQYRPRRISDRPIISGPQTAVVVGPKGKEIHLDDYGRVKVQFHWDRYGKADERSSCWIRVAQSSAGPGWGTFNIPRIGHEVIVYFLDGDPDRPIINGCVYNGENRPPVSNAGRKTPGAVGAGMNGMMTSLRSQSLGGSGGHNEITMNDTAGAEGLFIKAQKDEVHTVGNNREDTVGNDEQRSVGNNQTISIGVNKTESIGTNASEKVGVAKVIDVGSTLLIKAGTSITLNCGASTIHMNQAGFITISGTVINIAAAVNANMAAPITNVAGAILSTNTGAVNLVTGANTLIATGGSVARVTGGQVETLANGDNVVKGTMVKINT